ncbi:cytochrome D1 domain-containing protein [Rhodalgimonas zhirmunskyi]|uniref:Nitrite reductase n=1 Tax=Rhodalgimonas zhirmunskyi TaxID=2964767 RepID=A0AAJ1X5D3_9RHOB|nr:cytochrome D1 domain-containing protein [Rhodoalgimonas zhirmunskyi]MDQ2095138.1 nitrite reductase [Rhodoalgimonas zhirmunskyi]
MIQSTAFSDRLRKGAVALAVAGLTLPAAADRLGAQDMGATIYNDLCASCHGESRLGGIGPALIPESLARLRGASLDDVIAHGRAATQMPAFADQLTQEQIAAVAAYIKTPLDNVPDWTAADILAAREMNPDYMVADAPVFDADPMNITLVVETGDHHVSVLDGDTFEVLDRFPTPFAVHGGPKFSPDGRYVFVMSRDGWVQKYDIWSLQEVGRTRAGVNSRNIAMSADGKWLAVANYLPHSLSILSTEDLTPAQVRRVVARDGSESRVSAVYQAPQRESFILALKDAPEIWEIGTTEDSGPYHDGFVHSHEAGMKESLGAEQGLFARRRIEVAEPLDDFFFTPDYRNLIGASRSGDKGVVVNLDVGREIAELPLPGMPHLGSGISWMSEGRQVMATPHLREGRLSVIDTADWSLVKTIETMGPGFFLRSHENTPYVWADVFFGPNKDKMHIIDKDTLEIVRTLDPEPGKTVAHIEFTRDGKYALVSIWEDDGAVIVYDAETLEEVRRLPMRKPSGKYNVWNKITFSDGTSH